MPMILIVPVVFIAGFVLGVLFAREAVVNHRIETMDRELFDGHPPGAAMPLADLGEWVSRG